MITAAPTSLDELFALYASLGHLRYGEGVSGLDHARQCAALALSDGADDELVAAALFHDVGWFLRHDECPDHHAPKDAPLPGDDHASWGARILSPLLGPNVAQPVALHVIAKRWRCTIDPDYFDELSEASQVSFISQGGPLHTDERVRFETHQGFAAALALRSWDDRAKIPDAAVPELEHYRPLATKLAHRHARSRTHATSSPGTSRAHDAERGEGDT